MTQPISTEELLRQLDEQHQAYLTTFRQIHEALAKTTCGNHQVLPTSSSSPSVTAKTSAVGTVSNLMLTRASTFPRPLTPVPPFSPTPDSPRLSIAVPRRHRKSFTELDGGRPVTIQSSVTGESDESDNDDDLYVQIPLPSYKYDYEDLRSHLKTYTFKEHGEELLKTVVSNKRLLDPALFPKYPEDENWHHSHYSVFDVSTDGAPLSRREAVKDGTVSIDSAVWQAIQDLNADSNSQRPAVGRITVVREPSPIMLGALHFANNKDFDMDEIFQYLVEEDKSTAHMLNRSFSPDHRRQRTFVFEFDYFTIVGDEVQPMPWQRSDSAEKILRKGEGHIPISRCSSVVALSLGGYPIRKLRNPARKARTQHGFVYDPWAPWQVLSIQCYPDHKHSMDSHDSTNHYVNGPEAFLNTLLAEFRDAQKRFEDIYIKISKLVIPPADFMFNGDLRDKLLFEDAEFTYSRRYFWAYQTLGLMNDSIKAIMDAYEDTFTDDVWEGRHKSLWPMIDHDSHRNVYWRKRMATLKEEFDREIKNMLKLFEKNDDRRKEIRTLRDQLFSGTSVLESRKSVELSAVTILQGHNIKLLTLVSIFFLPLTFVTSVFGMSNMGDEVQFTDFTITMIAVCVPFFLLIGSLNTTSGMEFWRRKWHVVLAWLFRNPELLLEDSSPKRDNGNNPDFRKKRTFSHNEATQAIEIRKAQTELRRQSSISLSSMRNQERENDVASPSNTPPQIEISGEEINSHDGSIESTLPKGMKHIISPTVPAEKGEGSVEGPKRVSWWERLRVRRRKERKRDGENV
ncbi:uncharacterized protein RSE6_02413 [Rhynchosporium secalis]|uniref:Uncharacterized protein n=1 Tax=Rhynchosporium secalis TaxID=38038 RepID=A0A1E1M075_RHYSE|nr:uncharacterized protein RSE6_02413 [Rhynchosporium secalis]